MAKPSNAVAKESISNRKVYFMFADSILCFVIALVIVHQARNSTISIVIGGLIAALGVNFLFKAFDMMGKRRTDK